MVQYLTAKIPRPDFSCKSYLRIWFRYLDATLIMTFGLKVVLCLQNCAMSYPAVLLLRSRPTFTNCCRALGGSLSAAEGSAWEFSGGVSREQSAGNQCILSNLLPFFSDVSCLMLGSLILEVWRREYGPICENCC